MDHTKYRVNHSERTVSVHFDVRDQENCCIELDFTEDDLLTVINMVALGKAKVELGGISGFASLPDYTPGQGNVCFSYASRGGYGFVHYPYSRVCELFEFAFGELMQGLPSDD